MKKILFILFFIPSIGFSQSSLGLKTGVTFYKLYNYGLPINTAGANLGIIYSNTFSKFQITVEPSINAKNHVCFEVPVTFGWIPVNEKFFWGINTGLAPGILLSKRPTFIQVNGQPQTVKTFDIDFISGIKGGINFNNHFFLAFNFRYGLNLNNTSNNYFSPFAEAGYKF